MLCFAGKKLKIASRSAACICFISTAALGDPIDLSNIRCSSASTEAKTYESNKHQSFQGVHIGSDEFGYNTLFLSHGYSFANMTRLDMQLEDQGSFGVGGLFYKRALLSDIASDQDSVLWTDYRGKKLHVTNFELSRVGTVALGDNFNHLVGIVFDPVTNRFLVPSRSHTQLASISNENAQWQYEIIEFSFDTSEESPLGYVYDISAGDDFIYLTTRETGQIWRAKRNPVKPYDSLRFELFISGLNWPQHTQIFDGYIYILETKGKCLSKLSLHNSEIERYDLGQGVYRGMAVQDHDTIFLTGFPNEDEVDENKTILTKRILTID